MYPPLNGAVHFGVYDECKSSCQLVLSFDLGDEVFRLISLPNAAVRQGIVQTSVIGGSLSLLFYYDRHVDNNCCAIWVMKDYGVVDSWAKLLAVDVNKEIIRVLGLRKNGSILVEAELTRGWGLSLHMTPRANKLRIWVSVEGHTIFMLIIMWRTLSYLTNRMMQFPKGEFAGRGNAGISLIQLKISAFAFLSLILFLIYTRYCCVVITYK